MKRPSRGHLARSAVLLSFTALMAGAVALSSGGATYVERLLDIVAKQGLSNAVYDSADESPELKAIFLDAAPNPELTFKMQLALAKYPHDARKVLETFAGDPVFREVLTGYGEGVVPVIGYFQSHDVATLRALHWATVAMQTATTTATDLLRGRHAAPTPPAPEYGSVYRGRVAIEATKRDGHRFLAQFAIDGQGIAHWNQTDRALKILGDFFVGGVRDLETKHDIGRSLTGSDVAWAGVDVVTAFGAWKALKFLGQTRTAAVGKAAEQASMLEKTTVFGRRVLMNDAIGMQVAKLGAKVAAVYLVVRHPGLLSGLFVDVGKLLGLSPWLAMWVGWSLVLLPLVLLVGPLLGALGFLVPVITGVVRFGRWLRPRGAPMV